MNNINVCLWNWKDYNEGIANWKWFTLPEDEYEMWEWIEKLYNEGREEIFICDSEHSFISESTDLDNLVELSNMDYYEIIELTTYEIPYSMEEFDFFMESYTPNEIANMIHFGSYKPSHDYFIFDGAGNIETMSDTERDEHLENAFNAGANYFLYGY